MERHYTAARDAKEPLNVSQLIGVVKSIYRLSLKPKENEIKQIELLLKLENFISPDENGDVVIEKIFSTESGCLRPLLHLINICHYPHVVLRALSLIHKCLTQKRNAKGNSARRISLEVIYDEWPILLNVFFNMDGNLEFANCSSKIIDDAYYYLLSIISNICKKDKYYWMNFEQPHVLRKLLYLLTKYKKSFKMSVVVLITFKNMIRSRTIVETISTKSFFENLEYVLAMLRKKKSNKIKLIPVILKLLTKYDNLQESIFETKLIQNLLSLLANDDNLPVTYSICRTILFSINKIIKKESTFRHFKNHSNIRSLYRFCSHFAANEDKDYTNLLKACSIIHTCIEKRQLPIAGDNCYENSQFRNSIAIDDDVFSDDNNNEEEEEDELESDSDESEEYDTNDEDMCEETDKEEWATCYSPIEKPLNVKPYESVGHNIEKTPDISMSIYNNIDPSLRGKDLYCNLARKVLTKRQFVNIPYPDMMAAQSCNEPHLLLSNHAKFSRSKLIEILDTALNEKAQPSQVVFDLDQLQKNGNQSNVSVKCNDLENLIKNVQDPTTLHFESRFEEGNLRKVIKVNKFTYDLILAPDVNVKSRYQWFYFQISNMKAHVPYVFNIINCDKSNTQYNNGMQPVMFSVKESVLGRVGWIRNGSDICYYRNNYVDRTQPESVYHTLSFTVRFPHNNDVCYLAYHYPYTYTRLLAFLYEMQANPPSDILCTVETLCHTLANNPVPLVTITAPETATNPIQARKPVVLTSRVHPAESNSSWAMEGTLRYLLQDNPTTRGLRNQYVFKIVPMQNPEGVIYGSYRYGLTAEDLNRCWRNPDAGRHPEVFHVKAMIRALKRLHGTNIALFIDYHGHSRKRNFFLYGCSNRHSWMKKDRRMPDQGEEYMHYPTALADTIRTFSMNSCKFNVEKVRETTARVTAWRELAIKRSYTMECTYCGFDIGPLKCQSINTAHLFEIGASLMRALWATSGGAVDVSYTGSADNSARPV